MALQGNDPLLDAVGRGLDPAVRRFLLPGNGRGAGKFQPLRLPSADTSPTRGGFYSTARQRLPSQGLRSRAPPAADVVRQTVFPGVIIAFSAI